jgi:hypothetical protein
MGQNLKPILANFRIYGDFLSAQPYGSGHINDTYCAVVNQGGSRVRYIVQRLNHNIFKNVPALMENIRRVTEHLREKMKSFYSSDVSRRVMTLVPTLDNQSYYQDKEGNYWRVYVFIEKALTYDTLTSTSQAFEAAKAFGQFQKMLADLPGGPLYDTIPDFHNGPKRLAAFKEALAADSKNRAIKATGEIRFLEDHAWIFDVLPEKFAKGEIPLRTTHNDTKINNVMLDEETGEGVCVIDLDTVMPGLALYDFGDMVRTSTTTTAEDELDLSKVVMLKDRFEALVRGYLSSAGGFLNHTEIDHLVFAGKLITLIIGTRFLTDYLMGDQYFKIHRENHNLDRCRTQFRLVESITEQEGDLNAMVQRIIAK